MEKNYFTDLVGIGVTFPIQLSRNENGETGWYPVNGDFKLIRDNIRSVLYYNLGQRFRQEEFGNRLWQCIEEPNTQALTFFIKELLKQSVEVWEQRITFKDIQITRKDAEIHIEVSYVINGTNTSQYLNIVYDKETNSLNT